MLQELHRIYPGLHDFWPTGIDRIETLEFQTNLIPPNYEYLGK